ncbi:ABC transporter family substrate-binding protein [Streptomyces sp. B-S-A8]|uniref:ABC transporter family substrate-binding protein n=1 Tax=Streptomyces solicavernae TaxID=3043614 RepID=A0ABT6RZI1_9ACTN|nr:ABC transporter family substrate-binding protein [Streptomyces sp. B-S-A8]MDI3389066.1 ABC transporter family substrate-binding protein [Streptomyces sp. B-S-A8]
MARIDSAGVRKRHVRRAAALLTTGVLAVPALAGCGSGDESVAPAAAQDIAPAARDLVADGGEVTWAVDALPQTLNTFQADASPATRRVAGAVLPSMFTLDEKGRPQADPDFLEKAEIIEREPKQVVLYKLNQQAVWSDGREIGAADFAAQWRALSGKDNAYWTARNAGYDRIEKVERGANDLEVRVTFAKPYADWRSLFSPLYPKQVMGTPDSFNDGARTKLKVSAGPFSIAKTDRKAGEMTLVRNPRWWGETAKLEKLVFRAVPRAKRAEALAAGKVDLAEIGAADAERIELARRESGSKGPLAHGPGADRTPAQALRSWAIAHGAKGEEEAEEEIEAREKNRKAIKRYAEQQNGLRAFRVRKSLEPAYTQLALNGAEGPLADERVRRAVARAIDRKEIAETVLKPLGLPAEPVGSHLALAGQYAYADNSKVLGKQDTAEAQALLADAGWERGGAIEEKSADSEAAKKKDKSEKDAESGDGTYIVGQDDKPGDTEDRQQAKSRDAVPGAYAPKGTAAPKDEKAEKAEKKDSKEEEAKEKDSKKKGSKEKESKGKDSKEKNKDKGGKDKDAKEKDKKGKGDEEKGKKKGKEGAKGSGAKPASGPLAKDGKALTLRFVLPSGPGSEALRTVGEKISRMLEKIGVRTEIEKVDDDSYFKDHIASGQYDLALYSWPASAYPATDGRPIFAKPVPAADGSLNVEQNYTRVGTDHIDQLFEQAVSELDEVKARELVRKADARIWAAAGSIPLYQRPQLYAARPNLANAGAFGFESPDYEDIGFLKRGAAGKGPEKNKGPEKAKEPEKNKGPEKAKGPEKNKGPEKDK